MQHYNLVDFHPTKDKKPLHVGLIPDGTGRWGELNNIPIMDAYMYAMGKIAQFIEFFFEKGTPIVSIYLSSIQNFRRPKEKIEAFCRGQEYFIETELKTIIKKYPNTNVIPVGNTNVLPEGLKSSLFGIRKQQETIINPNRKIYLCVAYNPLEEILQATSTQTESFPNSLSVKEPLDLVIRTSGANLLSNFLPLQSGYARLYWLDKLYPEVSIDEYENIYNEFVKLERKYGD